MLTILPGCWVASLPAGHDPSTSEGLGSVVLQSKHIVVMPNKQPKLKVLPHAIRSVHTYRRIERISP